MGDKGFTPDVVAAIVDEAKKQNIPVVAHIGNAAQVRQLADMGVTDFMHEARDGMNPEFIAYAKRRDCHSRRRSARDSRGGSTTSTRNS